MSQDTIAAVATPAGRGGIGIIRVSGPHAQSISHRVLKKTLEARVAYYGPIYNNDNEVLDVGISLFFPGPHSFTGEDVVEFQCHGGPVILDMLLEHLVLSGCRIARPGEFSERAFLNDKIDLTQAEAIADLIDAQTKAAARSALHSLQGEFSSAIQQLIDQLVSLRIYVEAAIDFPEEEIDFLSDGKVASDLAQLVQQVDKIKRSAQQGVLMREGMHVVIVGKPNAGKSSLLNALSGHERAIVTDIAGTTRDVLKESIQIDGMPLHVIDTAGLRETDDEVEKIGVARATQEMLKADQILLVMDATESKLSDPTQLWSEFADEQVDMQSLTIIRNKIDQTGETPGYRQEEYPVIRLSAKTGSGMEALKSHLKQLMGYQGKQEASFIARKRHLDAIDKALLALQRGQAQLSSYAAGELLAEDLKNAQQALTEITGEFTSDDLLGKIFSSFCIGK